MSKLILLYGNIASGKSTLSRDLAKAGCVVVNNDSVVTMLHGGMYELYDEKLKPLYKGIEKFIIEEALKEGIDVVIDRTLAKRKTREAFISLGKKYNAEIMLLETGWGDPAVHAERRFNSDSRGLTYETWLGVAETKDKTRDLISEEESKEYDSIVRA